LCNQSGFKLNQIAHFANQYHIGPPTIGIGGRKCRQQCRGGGGANVGADGVTLVDAYLDGVAAVISAADAGVSVGDDVDDNLEAGRGRRLAWFFAASFASFA
jgi:hypothetical protein